MIESGLLFATGFLSAILLAMIVAPAIWRRAVFLTRKRIETAVPLTVNELQADKDRLRAEHAIAQRKLDMSLRKQRDIQAAQAAEISALSQSLAEARQALTERDGQLNESTREGEKLRAQSQQTGTEMAELRMELGAANATLETHKAELEAAARLRTEVDSQLEKARDDIDRRSGLVAKLEQQLGRARQKARDHKQKAAGGSADLRQTAQMLKSETKRAAKLEAKLADAEENRKALEATIKKRENELDALRSTRAGSETDHDELVRRASDAEAERDAIEREMGEMTVTVNRIAKVLGGRDPEALVEGLNARIAQLMLDVEAERERAETAKEALAEISTGESALREQIAVLAAQVVHMAARLEGETSPIPELVREDGPDAMPEGRVSLAARVRALQEEATSES